MRDREHRPRTAEASRLGDTSKLEDASRLEHTSSREAKREGRKESPCGEDQVSATQESARKKRKARAKRKEGKPAKGRTGRKHPPESGKRKKGKQRNAGLGPSGPRGLLPCLCTLHARQLCWHVSGARRRFHRPLRLDCFPIPSGCHDTPVIPPRAAVVFAHPDPDQLPCSVGSNAPIIPRSSRSMTSRGAG